MIRPRADRQTLSATIDAPEESLTHFAQRRRAGTAMRQTLRPPSTSAYLCASPELDADSGNPRAFCHRRTTGIPIGRWTPGSDFSSGIAAVRGIGRAI